MAVRGGGGGLGEVKGQGVKGCDTAGLDFLTRKSLSSSDGEITLGETMEEILEESEFWSANVETDKLMWETETVGHTSLKSWAKVPVAQTTKYPMFTLSQLVCGNLI